MVQLLFKSFATSVNVKFANLPKSLPTIVNTSLTAYLLPGVVISTCITAISDVTTSAIASVPDPLENILTPVYVLALCVAFRPVVLVNNASLVVFNPPPLLISSATNVNVKFANRPMSLPSIVNTSPTVYPLPGVVISTLVTAVSDVMIVALTPLLLMGEDVVVVVGDDVAEVVVVVVAVVVVMGDVVVVVVVVAAEVVVGDDVAEVVVVVFAVVVVMGDDVDVVVVVVVAAVEGVVVADGVVVVVVVAPPFSNRDML